MNAKWTPNAAQRAVLEQLKNECALEKSQADFAKNHLPFGPAKLSKILNALEPELRSYFDEINDPDAEMERIAVIVEDIPKRRALTERLNSHGVIELSQFRAVRVAVEECKAKRSPERVVKYLAPTGGGKTMLCSYLSRKCGARVVESREAWKRSYYTVLEDLSRALGCRMAGETRPAAMEDRIVEMQSAQTTVLAIDEGEFFGAMALNGFKLLLNKTRLVPVICSIPDAHDRWNRFYPMEADQITRRTHAIVELGAIDPKDAGLFFPKDAFKDRESALQHIAEEASRFGHYSFLTRMARRLSGVDRNDVGDVKKATEATIREMRRAAAIASK